jgi:hypothetical protein
MKEINNYRSRFYNLLESTIGDVKPLISEQSEYPKPTPTPNPGNPNRPLPEPVTPTRPANQGVGVGGSNIEPGIPPAAPPPVRFNNTILPSSAGAAQPAAPSSNTVSPDIFATPPTPPMPSAYSNSTEPTKSGEGYLGTALSVHKVAAGENLTNIAKTYGVTVDQILKSNPQIKNKNMIKVGEIINIER